MKTIRKGCFETNSSSMHSLTFAEKGNLDISKKLKVSAAKEFGGNYEVLNNSESKISYWFMQFLYYLNDKYINLKGKYYSERLDYRDFKSFVDYRDIYQDIRTFYDFPWTISLKRDAKIELNSKIEEVKEYFSNRGCELEFDESFHIDGLMGDYYVVSMAGFIDHASTFPENTSFKSFVELPLDELYNFVFNPKCEVILDNDN